MLSLWRTHCKTLNKRSYKIYKCEFFQFTRGRDNNIMGKEWRLFLSFFIILFLHLFIVYSYVLYSTAVVISSIKIVLALNPNIPELYVIKNLQTHKSWRYVEKIPDILHVSGLHQSLCEATVLHKSFYNCVFVLCIYVCGCVWKRESILVGKAIKALWLSSVCHKCLKHSISRSNLHLRLSSWTVSCCPTDHWEEWGDMVFLTVT